MIITITYNLDNHEHINISLSYPTNDYLEAKELAEYELLNILEIHPLRATLISVEIEQKEE